MNSEQQYIDLYRNTREQICAHSADALNAVRDAAFADFERLGFPSRKVERYKYTTIDKLFEPNYGLNINRIEVPVDPYKAFRCDVPNLSTSLYFIVNDQFRQALQPKENLPEGIVVASLADYAKHHDIDLIVMGRRGLGAIRGMLGSVSYSLLRETDIPVLTVK